MAHKVKGGGVQNVQKTVLIVYGWPLKEEDTTESFHIVWGLS